MNAQDLTQLLRRRPFLPFRLRLDDGQTFEVRHPELMMVGKRTATIGFPAADETELVYDKVITVSLLHIVTIEPIQSEATA